jgi:hypothetical protein
MKAKKNTSPPISNPIPAEKMCSQLVKFVEFAEALAKGACPGHKKCRKFKNLKNATASKAASVIDNRGGKGIESVERAWLTIVQSLITVKKHTTLELKKVAEHLQDPDLINPRTIYKIHSTPTEAAEEIRFYATDSLTAWGKDELLDCAGSRDHWYAYLCRRELAARRNKRSKKPC